jgi:hypothetical protein
MKTSRFALAISAITISGILLAFAWAQPQTQPNTVEAAFGKYWAARSPSEADQAVADVLRSGVTFDDAFRRLQFGRAYSPQKPGVIRLSTPVGGVEHFYSVNVPESYDPSRRYQVRFQLHGGIGGRPNNQPRGTGEIGALAGAEQFYVIPYAWSDSPWWSDDQISNLNAIVDSLKRTYNIDENRVVVSGVSDGGTGTYYIAMHETTPFASFLPLNGSIMVLSHDSIDDGGLFPNNLRNKPMFVVNGGRDRLYPTSVVEPFVRFLMNHGVDITYRPQPNGEHNTAWWPEVKDSYEGFVAGHPRDPHPDKLVWETADLSHNRAHWLVIDQLGAQADDAHNLEDVNVVNSSEAIAPKVAIGKLFIRIKSPGRVELLRDRNIVHVSTQNVAAFTLLLSPNEFDFNQSVRVVANNRVVFDGRLERNTETLLKWAARDNDRTMLYGAELQIRLTR